MQTLIDPSGMSVWLAPADSALAQPTSQHTGEALTAAEAYLCDVRAELDRLHRFVARQWVAAGVGGDPAGADLLQAHQLIERRLADVQQRERLSAELLAERARAAEAAAQACRQQAHEAAAQILAQAEQAAARRLAQADRLAERMLAAATRRAARRRQDERRGEWRRRRRPAAPSGGPPQQPQQPQQPQVPHQGVRRPTAVRRSPRAGFGPPLSPQLGVPGAPGIAPPLRTVAHSSVYTRPAALSTKY